MTTTEVTGRLSRVTTAPRVPEGKGGTLLTLAEVARFFSVRDQTVRNWCNRGLIPHGKLGRDLRFDRNQVQDWLESQWTAGSVPPDTGEDDLPPDEDA